MVFESFIPLGPRADQTVWKVCLVVQGRQTDSQIGIASERMVWFQEGQSRKIGFLGSVWDLKAEDLP